MEIKKNPNVDVKNKRFDFLLVGMTVALLIVLGAFSFTVYDKQSSGLENIIIEEDVIVMEQTVQEKKEKPKPPPTLEVLPDEAEIDEDAPEIEDTDTDQDEAIDWEPDDEGEEEPEETNEVLEIFDVSEKAEFPGGDDGLRRFIAENINYPEMAIDADISGTVNVVFVVTKDGKVRDIGILGAKKGFGLEEEAIRVIQLTSGRWKPAKQRDRTVNMRFRMPVKFQIF